MIKSILIAVISVTVLGIGIVSVSGSNVNSITDYLDSVIAPEKSDRRVLAAASITTPPSANPVYNTRLELQHSVTIPCGVTLSGEEDCSKPAKGWEKYTWGGRIGAQNLKLPYVKTLGDYLEGPYYNSKLLKELIDKKVSIIDQHGPIDKLLTKDTQDRLRRAYIRRVNAGQLVDPAITAPDPPPGEPPDPVAFKTYLATYFPGDTWFKVPMAARGNMTVTGNLSIASTNNDGGDGTDDGAITRDTTLTLDIPQLARSQEIGFILFKTLLPQGAHKLYSANQEIAILTAKATMEQENIPVAGEEPVVEFTESIGRGGAHVFKKIVVVEFAFPLAQNLWHYTGGPSGVFTAVFKPIPLFDEEEAAGPGNYTFEQTKARGDGQSLLLSSIRSQGPKRDEHLSGAPFLYPYLESAQNANKFAQKSTRPQGL